LIFIIAVFFITACQDNSKDYLRGWIGVYEFEETEEFYNTRLNENTIWKILYKITIYEEKGEYFANIEIDGDYFHSLYYEDEGEDKDFTMMRVKSQVFGNENWISLTLLEYFNHGILKSNSESSNDVLISFRREKSDIYTYWGRIQTIVWDNLGDNEIYFEKINISQE